MNLIELKCKECGASLKANAELKKVSCNYCGVVFFIDDGTTAHVYKKIDEARIKEAETNGQIRLKELEMEAKEKEYKRKVLKYKLIASLISIVIGIILFCLGNFLGNEYDEDWGLLSMLGLFPFMAPFFIFLGMGDSK